jgi:hypothetical protein
VLVANPAISSFPTRRSVITHQQIGRIEITVVTILDLEDELHQYRARSITSYTHIELYLGL